jgi:hypothetical protein
MKPLPIPSSNCLPTWETRMTHPSSATRRLPARLSSLGLCLALTLGAVPTAQAHGGPSDASLLSTLPVAVSVAAPVVVLSAGAALTVVSVQATAIGSVWVLERASDGTRISVQFAGDAVSAVGTGVLVLAMSTGWVLSAAGQALCFIPNEIGASLLHNEQVLR